MTAAGTTELGAAETTAADAAVDTEEGARPRGRAGLLTAVG